AGRARLDEHPGVVVAQGRGAAYVGADVVAQDQVTRGAGPEEVHAVAGVAGDDVAGRGSGAADRVAGGAVNGHADEAVAQGGGAGVVGADEVAGDQVVRAPAVRDVDSDAGIGADDVPPPPTRPASGLAGRARLDDHAVGMVSQGRGAGYVGTDVVAQDHV